jgi:DnaK suppressor protein
VAKKPNPKPAKRHTRAAAKTPPSAATGIAKRPSRNSVPSRSPTSGELRRAAAVVPPITRLSATPETTVVSDNGGPLTDEQLRKVKTGLTRRDLDRYRDLLQQKRAEILGDVDSLQIDARNKNTGGNLSNMPLHMADVGSDNYEQEFTLGLVESERALLREIDEALLRIKNRTYGVCLERGIPIAKPRLDAKPWAKYCIEVAREKERRGLVR